MHWIALTCWLIVIAAVVAPPARASTPACVGDCDGDGQVTINELITAVIRMIAITGTGPTCPALDVNGDGSIEISEIVAAVNSNLYGCNK